VFTTCVLAVLLRLGRTASPYGRGFQTAARTLPMPLRAPQLYCVGAAIASELVPPHSPCASKRAEAVCFTATGAALTTANTTLWFRRSLLACSARQQHPVARHSRPQRHSRPSACCLLAPTRTGYCWRCAALRGRACFARGSARWQCANEKGSGVCQHHKATRDAVAATRDETAS